MATASGGTAPDSQPAEQRRLDEDDRRRQHWKRWGPYISERAWGTIREDYSPDGSAWEAVPHDHARSKAYRWNEDGLAGVCDRISSSVLHWPCGMAAIPSLRNASLA